MAKKIPQLINYRWEGINRGGQRIKGHQEGKSIALVKAELRKKGIIAKRVYKKRPSLFNKTNKRITQGDITLITRQLSTMLEAGIPLIQTFEIIIKGQTNKKMQQLINKIKTDVESGLTLAESLHKHPTHFNELYCNLVDAGEKSGSLEIMLDNVASYKEKIESIKKKIKKALAYPIAVLVIAFLVSAGLLIFVVPQFETLFQGFGADLPALTRAVIDLSEFFQSYWYLIFGAAAASIYAFLYARMHSERFAHYLDKISLKIPIIGSILEKAAIARFSRTLAITFAAGLPLYDALKSVAGATGNFLFSSATNRIREDVATGQQIRVAMENTQLFPMMVVQMVAIGEESGSLEKMLTKVADFYEEEVDTAVDSLSSLLEPIIMAILGVLVGGLVVAMYLPIFKLGAVV